MKIKSPISEGMKAEKLYNYMHKKIDGLEDYKWKGKKHAYKKLNVENSPYTMRSVVRWEVDWTKTRDDVIDLTFAVELSIGQGGMLVPFWELTYEDIAVKEGIDSAFEDANEELDDLIEEISF